MPNSRMRTPVTFAARMKGFVVKILLYSSRAEIFGKQTDIAQRTWFPMVI